MKDTSGVLSYTTCVTGLVKPLLELKKRTLTPKQLRQNNFALGAEGERSAVKFLEAKNYDILDINIRVKNSEVDLVAFDREFDEVVFVEVKARASADFGHPSGAVDQRKLSSMNRVARNYIKSKRLDKDFRFDIITLTPQGVEHFENVTWL